MNWLAKINLPVVVSRLGAFRSALLLFSVIGICLYSGYRIGNFYHGFQTQKIVQQNERLNGLYIDQNDAVKRINMLEVELEVERMANQKALSSMKAMEDELFQLKKDLAFYQKIMAPENEADGLTIEEVLFSETGSSNHYRYSVLLVQKEQKKRFAKGYIELQLVGSQNGKPVTINQIEFIANPKEELAFSFEYFQRIEGEFTLPDNFIVERVDVAAILPKGKWQKYHRLDKSIPWPLSINEIQVILD